MAITRHGAAQCPAQEQRARVDHSNSQRFGTASPALLDALPFPAQPQAPASAWLCSALLHFLSPCHSQHCLHPTNLSPSAWMKQRCLQQDFPPTPGTEQALLTPLDQEHSGAGWTKGRGHIQRPQVGHRAVPVSARTSLQCQGHRSS